MDAVNDYQFLKVGDIVRVGGKNFGMGTSTGVVVELGVYGQVYVFWPGTGKVSHSGKKWAELNLELIDEYH